MTNYKYVILWADGPCTKRVIGPFDSREGAEEYVRTDPDIRCDDAEVVALDEPVTCSACNGAGFLVTDSRDRSIRIERCDSCKKYPGDAEAFCSAFNKLCS